MKGKLPNSTSLTDGVESNPQLSPLGIGIHRTPHNRWVVNFAYADLRINGKNWLFFGSDRGGETAATCLSILASAKRHLIEPFAYVRDLLIALSRDGVELEPLLPDNWIKAHPEHVLLYRREEAEAAANARAKRRRLRREKLIELGVSS